MLPEDQIGWYCSVCEKDGSNFSYGHTIGRHFVCNTCDMICGRNVIIGILDQMDNEGDF